MTKSGTIDICSVCGHSIMFVKGKWIHVIGDLDHEPVRNPVTIPEE